MDYLSIEEALNKDRIITDFTKEGKCSNCGGCCSNFIPLTNSDINRIAKYIKQHNIKEIKHSPFNCMTNLVIDNVCPFRDNNNKCCTIYSVRPVICRSFSCNDKSELFKTTFELRNQLKKQNLREVFYD